MIQEVGQTQDEKMRMYMKCSKTQLAEMLIECNRVLKQQLEASRVSPMLSEVPSVEEIYKQALNFNDYGCHPWSFKKGALWMRDKLLAKRGI